ncbi:MAG: uncharacterized protein A8A55_1992 [Amphiamblys sp. WSBS2006]|nr:MAG: uncharacterized protein A8A55_1992 [Amphiamblys sp. WSBS2006]
MANQAAKKIVQTNEGIVRLLAFATAASLLFFAYRVLLSASPISRGLSILYLSLAAFSALWTLRIRRLVRAGVLATPPRNIEKEKTYQIDLILVSDLVLFLSVLTDYSALLLLTVPVGALYLCFSFVKKLSQMTKT